MSQIKQPADKYEKQAPPKCITEANTVTMKDKMSDRRAIEDREIMIEANMSSDSFSKLWGAL